MKEHTNVCEHCMFYEHKSAHSVTMKNGECHRNAPPMNGASWPRVSLKDWCGEFLDRALEPVNHKLIFDQERNDILRSILEAIERNRDES